jgi:hypothetical protein
MAVLFSDGFESGNLTAWSTVVDTDSDLSVIVGAALHGSYGLNVLVDNNTVLYVRDDTPSAEKRYRCRFYFDPNGLSMANNDNFNLVEGLTGTTEIYALKFIYLTATGFRLNAICSKDSSYVQANYDGMTDAPHCIEIDWKAATSAGANDGFMTVWLDGTQIMNLTGVDNDTRQIDSLALGGYSGIDTGTRGTFYLDDFASNNDGTLIGLISTGWTHIAKVKGVASASIAKVNGVAVASISKLNGTAV